MMKKINYKSDFDLILNLTDCEGREIGWPSHDWTSRFRTVGSARAFTASCRGGECVNCYNDGGRIRVVFDGHGLGCGRLHCEFAIEIPDSSYPDGFHRVVTATDLDVELVGGSPLCGAGGASEVIAPVLYRTAYDALTAGGYSGSYEEYCAMMQLIAETGGQFATADDVKALGEDVDIKVEELRRRDTDIEAGIAEKLGTNVVRELSRIDNGADSLELVYLVTKTGDIRDGYQTSIRFPMVTIHNAGIMRASQFALLNGLPGRIESALRDHVAVCHADAHHFTGKVTAAVLASGEKVAVKMKRLADNKTVTLPVRYDSQGFFDVDVAEECLLLSSGNNSNFPWLEEVYMLPWLERCEPDATVRTNSLFWLFRKASALKYADMRGWDLSHCGCLLGCFDRCPKLEKIDMRGVVFAEGTDISQFAQGCPKLVEVDMRGADTSRVLDFSWWAFDSPNLRLPLGFDELDFGNLCGLGAPFYNNRVITRLNLSGKRFNQSQDTFIRPYSCMKALTEVDVTGLDTGRATDIAQMFNGCSKLKRITGLNTLDTSHATYFETLFADAGVEELDCGGWDTSNVKHMTNNFIGCYYLKRVNIDGWDFSNVEGRDRPTDDIRFLPGDRRPKLEFTGTIHGIRRSINVEGAVMSAASAMVFINGLDEVEETQRILFGKGTYNVLSAEQIAVATAKGWNVLSSNI